MKHSDVKQLLLRNLLLVGLHHNDVLKQCQTMKNDACTAEHLLNLARQAEYRDITALRLTNNVTSSPEGYMARITFRLSLLNAFNNPMYCKAVCNRDAFNVFVYPNGNIIFM